jgi:hypothetical protein
MFAATAPRVWCRLRWPTRYPVDVLSESAERRWERIILGTKWLGIVLVAVAAYDIYDGDDLAGVVMTIAPAALCLLAWRFAQARLDQLAAGESGGWLGWAATAMCVAVGGAVVVLGALGATGHVDHAQRDDPADPGAAVNLPDDVIVQECPTRLASGQVVTIKTLTKGHCMPVDSIPQPADPK